MTGGSSTGPGRPRKFDPETALALGQRLFHARGYEAVGLAALTDALGIKPPSFYKAFGSKAQFFAQILDRYSASVLALDEILLPSRAPGEALLELIVGAARAYSHDPERRGCLVLEAVRGCDDEESVTLARRSAESRRDQVRAYVARSHPEVADIVTDYVASTMSGLSACAREGMSEDRLTAVARAAGPGLQQLLGKLGA
ncbi:TetR/AcrR family transcriptional regulator [Salinarimonas soli]|uniref:TetR/AcrR family transcriptional regulator n=1 Tax=Salinarimonas soli TaxID=1638099 RepID=A0A5B2V6X4_9HYPH|nr:TetR/AcrR family transcriptional regulator [Salinarimonas soli]KAA2234586.1 TetR/AcrR family transcriptional regulator [Salinarimonas soli]